MGVIDAYRMATKEVPELQLALVGSMATDDPEGWEFFQHTYEYADSDPDIKILNNLNNVGAIEVNAFQSQSDVLMQKSIREGFGLTVTEALWKGRPTIAGDVGGIPLQIVDGESGFLVSSARAGRPAHGRDPQGPGPGQVPGPRGQGARARALPDPAPAARLDAHLHLAGRLERRLHGSSPAAGTACYNEPVADERPLTIVSNRGPAEFGRDESGEIAVKRGGGGLVTALSGSSATARRSGSPRR